MSMVAPVENGLRCCNGHPIVKLKKELKPWQGLMQPRRCNTCAAKIERNQGHWRCEYHCDFDMCMKCYDGKRAKIYAKKQGHQPPTFSSQRSERPPTPQQAVYPRPVVQRQSRYDEDVETSPRSTGCFRNLVWLSMAMSVCLLAEPLVVQQQQASITALSASIPYPYFVTSVAFLLGFIICKVLGTTICRADGIDEQQLRPASALGVLCGFEVAFAAKVMQTLGSLGSFGLAWVALPLTVFLISTALCKQPRSIVLLGAMVAATNGGFLTYYQGWLEGTASDTTVGGGYSDALVDATRYAPWIISLCVVRAIRLSLTQKWLSPQDDDAPPAFLIASRMMLPAFFVCLELAFWFDSGCFAAFSALGEEPSSIPAYLGFVVLAAALTTMLTFETKVVQLSSAMLAGLIAPLSNFVALLVVTTMFHDGEIAGEFNLASISHTQWMILGNFCGAFLLYAIAQSQGCGSGQQAPENGYLKFEEASEPTRKWNSLQRFYASASTVQSYWGNARAKESTSQFVGNGTQRFGVPPPPRPPSGSRHLAGRE